ncbi:MAG: hypothetical protein ABI831_15855 [Betaproteobacteria bacterium]
MLGSAAGARVDEGRSSPGPAAASVARVDEVRSSPGPAAVLSARYAALKDELDNNPFRRPIHLDSTEGRDSVTGEIFALLSAPFATAGPVLEKPVYWCDILILHLNNKYCRPSVESRGTTLRLSVGSKGDQALSDAYRVNFVFRVSAKTADYLQVNLLAEEGPLGTRNYRVALEATPADDGRTFIRLSYGYSFGVVGQLAMRTYLNTVARNKVGFSVVPGGTGKAPQPVGGMRGAVERNTMRYYLAIEAFLGALSMPPAARLEKSLRDWFSATEAYPRQLHEIDQNEYLVMKRREYSRQLTEMN